MLMQDIINDLGLCEIQAGTGTQKITSSSPVAFQDDIRLSCSIAVSHSLRRI